MLFLLLMIILIMPATLIVLWTIIKSITVVLDNPLEPSRDLNISKIITVPCSMQFIITNLLISNTLYPRVCPTINCPKPIDIFL
ncbi:hypothetical protein Lalb_Chr04g0259011 [Lupinus albus]|uniref:Uncharacterized protein n=1 Tax=Lupinus albus TaxID=3870 RepID=A0A6A4QQ23_LUPAL|nr:hypothetical protein Lalb_Chr04g0259011 [Lupinus albus]